MKPMYSMRAFLTELERVPGAIEPSPPWGPESCGSRVQELIEQRARDAIGRSTSDSDSRASRNRDEENPVPGRPTRLHPVVWLEEEDAEGTIDQLAAECAATYSRETPLLGVDALAWYVSFHQTRYHWGVYLPITGVAWLAQNVLGNVALGPGERLALAAEAILAHEYMHYAVDCGIAQLEIAFQRALYWLAARSRQRESLRELEEALANGRMLRMIRTRRGCPEGLPALRAFTEMQPKGYRDGKKLAANSAKFDSELLDLAQESWEAGWGSRPPYGVELQYLYPVGRHHDLLRCPVHVVQDAVLGGEVVQGPQLIQAVSQVAEASSFGVSLQELGPQIVKRWENTKKKLEHSVQLPGLDFKRWPPGGKDCFSVRVGKSVRAHLRFERATGMWTAEAIGTHQAMGHG